MRSTQCDESAHYFFRRRSTTTTTTIAISAALLFAQSSSRQPSSRGMSNHQNGCSLLCRGRILRIVTNTLFCRRCGCLFNGINRSLQIPSVGPPSGQLIRLPKSEIEQSQRDSDPIVSLDRNYVHVKSTSFQDTLEAMFGWRSEGSNVINNGIAETGTNDNANWLVRIGT